MAWAGALASVRLPPETPGPAPFPSPPFSLPSLRSFFFPSFFTRCSFISPPMPEAVKSSQMVWGNWGSVVNSPCGSRRSPAAKRVLRRYGLKREQCVVLVCVKCAIWLVLSSTHHFLTDDSLQSADKDQQESCAVTGKPHDGVVKFTTHRNLRRHRAVFPAIARLSCMTGDIAFPRYSRSSEKFSETAPCRFWYSVWSNVCSF